MAIWYVPAQAGSALSADPVASCGPGLQLNAGRVENNLMSLQGRTLRMVRAGTPVSVGERVSDADAFTIYRASAGDGPLAVSWYPDLPGTRSLAKLLTWLVDIGSPHPAFTWPIDTVMSEEMPGFGLVMPLPEPGLVSLGQLLARTESPSFPVLISIGLQLVSAFEGLHEAAMCYRDIGLGTIMADADRGAIALVDIDAIAPDHSERYLGSSSPFMAPEVVRGEAPVSWRSDRHSLAVLLFFLFMHGHPLVGKGTDPDGGDEGEVALRAFGLAPVFVFDPKDDSNRPVPGDQVLRWWPVYPRFFRAVFDRAFTTGLWDPAAGRVTEEQWLSALTRLEDCVGTCSCGASVLRDPEDGAGRCWNCGLTLQLPEGRQWPDGSRAHRGRLLPRHSPQRQDAARRRRHGGRGGMEDRDWLAHLPRRPPGLTRR